MEVLNPANMNDITSDSNFLPAVNIPGLDYPTLNDLNTKFGDIDQYRGDWLSLLIKILTIKASVIIPINIFHKILILIIIFHSGLRRCGKS